MQGWALARSAKPFVPRLELHSSSADDGLLKGRAPRRKCCEHGAVASSDGVVTPLAESKKKTRAVCRREFEGGFTCLSERRGKRFSATGR
jgi:hypothetical protein